LIVKSGLAWSSPLHHLICWSDSAPASAASLNPPADAAQGDGNGPQIPPRGLNIGIFHCALNHRTPHRDRRATPCPKQVAAGRVSVSNLRGGTHGAPWRIGSGVNAAGWKKIGSSDA
jgi:hypothetical protein